MHPELARLLSSAVPFEQWEAEKFPPDIEKDETLVDICIDRDPVEVMVALGKAAAKGRFFQVDGQCWSYSYGSTFSKCYQVKTSQFRADILTVANLWKSVRLRDGSGQFVDEKTMLSAGFARVVLASSFFLDQLPSLTVEELFAMATKAREALAGKDNQ